MERKRWLQVKQIVNACLDMGPDRRETYIQEVCEGDADLLTEVQSLLASHADLGDFLALSVLDTEELLSGNRVGSYEIREAIAEGGMGTVYRAVRTTDFEKQVAVKVVKRGMDTKFILQRFRHERQILAGLDHPHIARLLDGGATADGRPYLVMEYIEGRPIAEYCEDHALKLSERLQLFRTVCSAVQYAHQNLVVHRDLKPGNILVTGGGVPKLLDFGIAKLLEPDADSTITSMRFMTPECASPEQVRGEPITTATDIYSLGVLLYQLMAGEPPYRFTTRTAEEIRRVVCEMEPKKPSVVRRLSEDLDNIVLKAMHKEPARRYASAEQLAEDIARYLGGRPVTARKDTIRYRASKFLVRHKATSLAAVLVILSLLGGMGATLWQASVSAVARRLAEERFKDVRSLATFNLFELNDALEKVPASAAARHLLIQRALEYLDKLRSQNSGDRELTREVALGYERIAELQGRFTGTGVGDSQASLASYRKALAIRSALVESSHQDPAEIKSQANLLRAYTRRLLLDGETGEALRSARTRLAIARQLANSEPLDRQARLDEVDADLILAWVLGGNGSSPSTREISEAIALDRAALKTLTGLTPGDATIRRRIAVARYYLAFHYWKSGEFHESLRTIDSILSMETAQSVGSSFIVGLYNWRGNTFARLGDHRRALRDYRQGLVLATAVAAADVHDRDARLELEILNGLVAIEAARLGNRREGLDQLSKAIASVEQMFAADPELFYQRILVAGYSFRGEILSSLGDQPAARENYAKALGVAEGLANKDAVDLESRLQIARLHAALGVLWSKSRGLADARRELASSLELANQLLVSRPTDREALDLAKTAAGDLAVLTTCTEKGPCRSAKQFELPTLLN